eukprot:TRINITY_DN9248_c0_g1_i2.p3 TRINITY_DN9248_c0_g1~~TRINITY_DN9248_c0_g1_i2.p3  ORF type:complete len:112 (-),score=11.44 TRINITY_DN9248_c0_g1_i2:1888-2223(-)
MEDLNICGSNKGNKSGSDSPQGFCYSLLAFSYFLPHQFQSLGKYQSSPFPEPGQVSILTISRAWASINPHHFQSLGKYQSSASQSLGKYQSSASQIMLCIQAFHTFFVKIE